jgi:hypothetical protein
MLVQIRHPGGVARIEPFRKAIEPVCRCGFSDPGEFETCLKSFPLELGRKSL